MFSASYRNASYSELGKMIFRGCLVMHPLDSRVSSHMISRSHYRTLPYPTLPCRSPRPHPLLLVLPSLPSPAVFTIPSSTQQISKYQQHQTSAICLLLLLLSKVEGSHLTGPFPDKVMSRHLAFHGSALDSRFPRSYESWTGPCLATWFVACSALESSLPRSCESQWCVAPLAPHNPCRGPPVCTVLRHVWHRFRRSRYVDARRSEEGWTRELNR